MKVRIQTDKVKRELTRRNISQNGLAIKLEISSGYCSQLLSGARCPSADIRQKLQDVLRLPFESLFTMPETEEAEK